MLPVKQEDTTIEAEFEYDPVAAQVNNYKLLAVIDSPRTISKTDVSRLQSLNFDSAFTPTRGSPKCAICP